MDGDSNNRSAQDALGDIGATLSDGVGAARRTLHDARDAAGERVSDFASKAAESASEQGEAVKGQVSEALGTFAAAVRTAADELARNDQGTAARFVQQAAGGLESLSGALGQKKLEDIVADIRGFGKSNPAAFMVGSVLAGIALGRFVRTSASHEPSGATGTPDVADGVGEQPDTPHADAFGSPFEPSAVNAEI